MTWLILAMLGVIALGGGSALAQDRQDRRQDRPAEPAAQDAGSGGTMHNPDGAEPAPGYGFGWAVRGAPGMPAVLHG